MNISRKISVWFTALFLLTSIMLCPNVVSAQYKAGLNITADLTGSGIRFVEKVPGNYSAVPGTVHVLDSQYFILPNKAALLMKYNNKYYIIPSTAQFKLDKYGHFCGEYWGNPKYDPINDGGLDKACREHDRAWANKSIAIGDKNFLYALKNIKPKWEYEADFVKEAIKWISCRVEKKIVTNGPESVCKPKAAWGVFKATISQVVQQNKQKF